MRSWLSKLSTKIGDSLTEKFASIITGVIIIVLFTTAGFFRKQLFYHITFTFPVRILVLTIVLLFGTLTLLYRRTALRSKKPRLRDENDIVNTINQWLNELYKPLINNQKYYFSELDRSLSIKRGSS